MGETVRYILSPGTSIHPHTTGHCSARQSTSLPGRARNHEMRTRTRRVGERAAHWTELQAQPSEPDLTWAILQMQRIEMLCVCNIAARWLSCTSVPRVASTDPAHRGTRISPA